MKQALLFDAAQIPLNDRNNNRWVLLPGLCCQGAGGNPIWADDLAAAWLLFYAAADLMDNVQDQDKTDLWWSNQGSGVALNSASGLFFTAAILLNRQISNQEKLTENPHLVAQFYEGMLLMCSGQHGDLSTSNPSLKEFWDIAAAKSGSFFSLGCRAGASLATKVQTLIDGYSKFGYHLGILIQALNDLEELNLARLNKNEVDWMNFSRSLPVIYALEVYPETMRQQLRNCLGNADHSIEAASESLQMINESGVVLYMQTQLEFHQSKALAALDLASPEPPVGEILVSLLDSVYKY